MKVVLAAATALLLVVVLLIAPSFENPPNAGGGLNTGQLPAAALELLEPISAAASECPDLPLPWLIAQIQVESSFNTTAVSPVGAAGLLQMMPATWIGVSGPGGSWPVAGPPAGHPVTDPATHLPIAVSFICTNLASMQQHIAQTGKPLTPLQAMAVCHIAGCSRVLRSATGVPTPGEAGCGTSCVGQIEHYLERIAQLSTQYEAVGAPGLATETLPAPAPYTGGATGCSLPDPGGGRCVTGATLHGYRQVLLAAGGSWEWGVGCWSRHQWNPSSDHPKGRACDFTLGSIGAFPDDQLVAHGWTFAEWLRANAGPLRITYIIWQGRIWQAGRSSQGWQTYGGGGVYNASSPTGGHYDHIHVSWGL